ncbi:hypothetical protein BRD16_05005 [Halobacteriales archaeon SW_6_65_46]|nr:MAG: hypothetical protein BRD16_05005 [Halobacteriales archaeon SW_6_65_46]
MTNSDGLTESEVRHAVREEISNAGISILSTIFWTLLAAFSVLVGLQAIQMAFYTSGLATVSFVAVGALVTGASVYLLYILHWA